MKFLFFFVPFLVGIAFLTLLERKVLSLVGLRLGPNKVSIIGILQPIGDAGKLMNKQINALANFSFFFYYFRSLFIFIRCLLLCSCLYATPTIMNFSLSAIILFAVLAFNSLNSICCG